MKQSHTFEKCYSLLNINLDCNWDDLRKTYRLLIKKWHPDQFMDEKEKSLATDKLKDLNTAYKQLADYYKKNGKLPLKSNTASRPVTRNTQRTNYKSRATTSKNIQKRKKYSPHIMFILLLSFMVAGYQYIENVISFLTPDDSVDLTFKKRNTHNHLKERNSNSPNESKAEYFTYGSSIGKVILIQGRPDKIIGNIWFYGKSEIHFKNGLVTKWIRSTSKPLKAEVEELTSKNINNNVKKSPY